MDSKSDDHYGVGGLGLNTEATKSAKLSGMLRQRDFWKQEGDASILMFNKNQYLQKNLEQAFTHAASWLKSMGIDEYKGDWDKAPIKHTDANRIYIRDAERTFKSKQNQEAFCKLVANAHNKFGDYQQSMGYVSGLLLLFFDPATTFGCLTVINDHAKYLPGYWRGEATACATDAWVVFDVLETTNPDVHKHLLNNGMLPHTFMQKWFGGLCINHLPYHILMGFLDRFFKQGNVYLFKFALAFMQTFEKKMLGFKTTHELSALLRFENTVVKDEELEEAIQRSDDKEIGMRVEKLNLHKARISAFENHLKKSLVDANRSMYEAIEEIEFSSDEEDEDDATAAVGNLKL